jgi:hypothetical protein
MRQLFIGLLSLLSSSLLAQTKEIAFKSHSGSNENFNIALENNLFDIGNSNFGHAPQRDVKTAQLDSVIFISDSVALMVTSEFCIRSGQTEKEAKLWKAGKETVYNHPLFSRKHSLDSIKNVIKEQYSFRNPVEQVVFVGYDNKTRKYNGNNIVPVAFLPDDNDQSPFGPQFVLILGLIIGLSLSAGFIAWLLYQRKNGKVGQGTIAAV